jgi:hypothetical protein
MVNCGLLIWKQAGTSFAASGLNNNVYATCTSSCWKYEETAYSTLAGWRTATGQEASAVYTSGSAGLDGTYHPTGASVVLGVGANLTSLRIAALNTDASGLFARPWTGAWDAGAHVFNRSDLQRPAAPTGLRIP